MWRNLNLIDTQKFVKEIVHVDGSKNMLLITSVNGSIWA
jgi:hypothetical protein